MKLRPFFLSIAFGFICAAFLFVAVFSLQLGAATESSRWSFELLQKKRSIARSTPHPQMIILGGSGVLFSVSAAQIEETLSIPTVNFGIHAALGSQYIFDSVRQNLRAGDTVVLDLEYEMYGGSQPHRWWKDELYLDYLMARDPHYFLSRPLIERIDLAMSVSFFRLKRGLQARFDQKRPSRIEPVYDAAHLGPRGDQISHRKGMRLGPPPGVLRPIAFLSQGWRPTPQKLEVLKTFCLWCNENHVRVLATFPAIPRNAAYQNIASRPCPAEIESFYRSLQVPVLERAADLFYSPDDFFDTMYHMTEEGAKIRTQHLTDALVAYFSGSHGTGDGQ